MILTYQEKRLGIEIIGGLKRPHLYSELTERQLDELTNGCGPKGAGWFVPEMVFSASFRVPCKIHDVTYLMGMPKKLCDQIFYENCMEKAKRCLFFLRPAAEWAAFMYYLAVKNCGRRAYLDACEYGVSLGINYKEVS